MSFLGTPLFLIPFAHAGSVPYLKSRQTWKGEGSCTDSHSSGVDVTISSLEGLIDSVLLGIFILPCTEADSWDGVARVEFEASVCEGHGSDLYVEGGWDVS